MSTDRLTPEREAEIREYQQQWDPGTENSDAMLADLLAALDAVRAERDALRQKPIPASDPHAFTDYGVFHEH